MANKNQTKLTETGLEPHAKPFYDKSYGHPHHRHRQGMCLWPLG